MAKVKTCEEYVLQKLQSTEDELLLANKRIATLSSDLAECHKDFENIKKLIRIEDACGKTEYKIMFYDDENCSYGTSLVYSGSRNPEKFHESFTSLCKLLHLELPGYEYECDINTEDVEIFEEQIIKLGYDIIDIKSVSYGTKEHSNYDGTYVVVFNDGLVKTFGYHQGCFGLNEITDDYAEWDLYE